MKKPLSLIKPITIFKVKCLFICCLNLFCLTSLKIQSSNLNDIYQITIQDANNHFITSKSVSNKIQKTKNIPSSKSKNKIKEKKDLNKKSIPSKTSTQSVKQDLKPIKNIVNDCKTELSLGQIVAEPEKWKDKEICFSGIFNSFSALALDYAPAMRERKKYISITLFRPKTQIPLSELKLAIKIENAQKHEYLSKITEGDSVKIKGTIFSTALGEPWIDINQIQVIKDINSTKSEEDIKKHNAEYLEGF